MIISDLISWVKKMKPDSVTYDNDVFVHWINEIEGIVQTDVMLLTVEGLTSYNYTDNQGTTLLVKFPHDRLYSAYLFAMVDFARGEFNKYQNDNVLFNKYMAKFRTWFINIYNPASGRAITLSYYLKGDTGQGLKILGFYATLGALEAAVTDPEVGDAYGVGSAEDFHYYVWDLQTSGWVDNGALAPQAAISAAAQAILSAAAAAESALDALASAGDASTDAAAAASSASAAEYWAGLAQAIAGGGVYRFNTRYGSVVPETGDYTAAMVGAIPTTEKGAANGVASLGADGKVPAGQLNELALGETSGTAYRGDRGKTAYDHSQATGNPHGAAAADITITDSGGHFTATAIEGALAELFTSVSDGKTALVADIEDRGGTVSVAGTVATFAELGDGIATIHTGSRYTISETFTALMGLTPAYLEFNKH